MLFLEVIRSTLLWLHRPLNVLPRKSSAIFGTLTQFSDIARKRLSGLRTAFGGFSVILGKCSEIFGESSKTSLLVCLYNKQNNTWLLVDINFSSRVQLSTRTHVLSSIYLPGHQRYCHRLSFLRLHLDSAV